MTCATNQWLFYDQCQGVTPDWFIANNGCDAFNGCLPQSNPCTTRVRRFSPYCRLIDVTPFAPQVYLRVAPSVQADSQSLTFTQSHVQLELRRKGCWTLIATYPAWRRDENGYIGFYFDDTFFSQCTGYYVGDIFIDCIYCFSINLRLPPCEAFITDCYVQPIMENCGQGTCSIVDTPGMGAIGGLDCSLPPAANSCGPVAPFFPIDNPPPPTTECNTTSSCCYTPATPAGAEIGSQLA